MPPGFRTRKISARGAFRIAEMLEHVQRENAIEDPLAKRQLMRIAHDVGVAKNLVLELDAIRVTHRRPAGADVKDEVLPFAQHGVERLAD